MKKLFILSLLPLLGITTSTLNYELVNAEGSKLYLSESQHETLIDQLSNAIRIESTVLTYDNLECFYLNEVDSTASYFSLTYKNEIVSEQYIVGDENDYAYYNKINISNKSELVPLFEEGDDDAHLTFSSNFGSPFRRLTKLAYESFNNYFYVTKIEDGYTLIPNNYGYGLLNNDIASFFPFAETFVWDEASVRYEIKDATFNLDELGYLVSFSFSRIKKDKFGAIKDKFTSLVTPILEAKRLNGLPPIMSEEEIDIFTSKVESFQAKLQDGNFTQKIETSVEYLETYNTYYMLDGANVSLPAMMISDVPFVDSTYGLTYFGLIEEAENYIPYAFSPNSDYMGTYSNMTFNDLSEVLPNFLRISADFFKNNGFNYVLDFTALNVIDYLFSVQILDALISPIDPVHTHTYSYINAHTFEYQLKTLSITFDASNNITAVLKFNNSDGAKTAKITFSDFGTTDIRNVSSLEPVVNLIHSYMGA